jgi:hypothetical protein
MPPRKPSYSSAFLPRIQRRHPSSPFSENRYASEPILSRGNFCFATSINEFGPGKSRSQTSNPLGTMIADLFTFGEEAYDHN